MEFVKKIKHFRDLFFMKYVIIHQVIDIFPRGQVEAFVPVFKKQVFLVFMVFNLGIRGKISCFQHFLHFVIGAIVANDDFDIRVGLFKYAVDGDF
ncbi:hypothetical protein PAALTS15_19318 [Paenibacillus alvei TS-15]|uniref:Uncharacterized protein n=1 Tax=Paenibacillus alvei TS-15 TaxID=1117108 RepID=S9SLJ3_PAEAL|nr:hypothetical protein PAALTS15_19318 [Paenibacillus alvei TS-15]